MRSSLLLLALMVLGIPAAGAQTPPMPTWWLVSRTPDALRTANLGAAVRSNGLALVEEALYYREPRTLKEGQVDYLRLQTLYDCNHTGKFKMVTVAGFQAQRPTPLFETKQQDARWGIAPPKTNLATQWTAACQNGQGATPLRAAATDQQVLERFRQQAKPRK